MFLKNIICFFSISLTLVSCSKYKDNNDLKNENVPNLFRASLKTKKSRDYLVKVNHLKNESQVIYGQKIYY